MVAFPEGSFAARHSRSLTVVALLFFVLLVGGAVVAAWLNPTSWNNYSNPPISSYEPYCGFAPVVNGECEVWAGPWGYGSRPTPTTVEAVAAFSLAPALLLCAWLLSRRRPHSSIEWWRGQKLCLVFSIVMIGIFDVFMVDGSCTPSGVFVTFPCYFNPGIILDYVGMLPFGLMVWGAWPGRSKRKARYG